MPARMARSRVNQSSTPLAHPQPRRAAPAESVTLQNRMVVPDVSTLGHSYEASFTSSIVADSGRIGDDECPHKSAASSNDTCPSDPKQWFDQSNENPTATFDSNVTDVDPPFFQRESDESSDDWRYARMYSPLRLATVHSSSADDYRSIIDDLTIEIRNLKEELKQYERQGPENMKKDKLFEIRFHGLSKRKVRELEATLRDFASGLEDSTERSSSQHRISSRRAEILSGSGSGDKNASSLSGSHNRPVDSAYASMCTDNTSAGPPISKRFSRSRARDIDWKVENYLRDIPEGLFPGYGVLIDKDRKKFVVRRLEQLFTGKIQVAQTRGRNMAFATDGNSLVSSILKTSDLTSQASQLSAPKPKPQSQITQSRALSGDHEAQEASRAARMQPQNKSEALEKLRSRRNRSSNSNGDWTESTTESREIENRKSNAYDTGSGSGSGSGNGNGNRSTNSPPPGSEDLSVQRSTQQNDLNPDRSQILSENMACIKHLGTLELEQEVSASLLDSAADADGWVYLNLLCNLAQLHIINATPSFVRSAISEISTTLQLSADGHKIRWRGSMEGIRLSNEGLDSAQRSVATDDSVDCEYVNVCKRQKVGRGTSDSGSSAQKQFKETQATNLSKSFQYKPVFHRNDALQGQTALDSTSSLYGPVKDSNASESRYELSGSAATSGTCKRRRHNGAIIYYSGSPFCIDLSGVPGDVSPATHMPSSQHTTETGETSAPLALYHSDSGSSLKFRPLANPTLTAEMEIDDKSNSEPRQESRDTDLEIELNWAGKKQYAELLPLEPSGVGGVLPDDHFMIFVKTCRPSSDVAPAMHLSRSSSQEMTDRIIARLAALKSTSSPSPVTKGTAPIGLTLNSIEYISRRIKQLPVFALPPPVMFVPLFSRNGSRAAVDFAGEYEDEGFESSTSQEYMRGVHESPGEPSSP